jgi:hypothetical protein
MRKCGSIRIEDPATRSLAQRIIACLLLLFVVFMVVNPICECHDHMDNLRHLGSHGFLVTLLLVVCAGISLVKLLRILSINALCSILRNPQSIAIPGRTSVVAAFTSLSGPPLPLRI